MLAGQRVLLCTKYEALRGAYNALHGLENAEDWPTLKRVGVLREMHRLVQRQIEWQRGFWNAPNIYRSAFIFGGEQSSEYFMASKGFSIADFMLASTVLLGLFRKTPQIIVNGGALTLSHEVLNRVMSSISLPVDKARLQATSLRRGIDHVSYKPSLLRRYPCIGFGNHYVAPLPDLITVRSTTGIFYDIVSGPPGVRAEIGKKFETYCRELLEALLPGLETVKEFNYAVRKNQTYDTPDLLIREHGRLVVIVECKATRMTYEARYSETPMSDGLRGYREIANGVFQIWRFVAHVRLGLVSHERLGPDVKGVVLTLDTWLTAANQMQLEVLELARALVVESGIDMLLSDQVGIIFCPIMELEMTLSNATESSFLQTVRAATEAEYRGWFLSSVHDRAAPGVREAKKYPFWLRIGEVLPWWKDNPG